MSKRKVLLLAIGLPLSVSALAAGGGRAKFTEMAANLASLIGAADYCGSNRGQTLLDAFARGLPHFDLSRADIDAVLVAIDQPRRQAREQSAATFANRPCPAQTREKMQQSLQEMENAWYRVVRNETGADLQAAAPAPVPVPAPVSAGSAAPPPAPNSTPCVKGRAVSVLYGGQWYPAKVLDGPDNMGSCLVSYDGYGRTGTMGSTPHACGRSVANSSDAHSRPRRFHDPRSGGASAIPPGKYGCYTFDNGQLTTPTPTSSSTRRPLRRRQ